MRATGSRPQPIGRTARELWDRGYAFDYVSDRQLQTAKVKKGEMQMPGGNYQVIVVPPCKYLPLPTLQKLLALAKAGATVCFGNLPSDVPGWGNLEKRRAEMNSLWKTLMPDGPTEDTGGRSLPVGRGQFLLGYPLSGAHWAKVPQESMTSSGLYFIRRSFDDGWHYFIANRSGTNFDGWITLGRPAKSVVIVDPMTGHSGVAASRESAAKSTRMSDCTSRSANR